MLKHGVELLNGFCMSAIIHMNAGLFTLCIFAPICFQVALHDVHYLCSLLSPSGSDPERSSNDEPGPLPRNPTPSHQPHCQQDSRCQVSPVPQVTFSHFPTHYMIDRFISQSESCLHCSALPHILSLPLTL